MINRIVQEYSGLNPIISDKLPAGGELYLSAPDNAPSLGGMYGQVQLVLIDGLSVLRGRSATLRAGEAGYRLAHSHTADITLPAAGEDALAHLTASAHTLLKREGTAAVLADAETLPVIKPMMDEVFGANMFYNEIILYTPGSSAIKRCFAQRHLTLLLYSRTRDRYINTSACGWRRGITRRNHMKHGEENGRAYVTMMSGGREYRYYEDEIIPFDDVWQLEELSRRSDEYAGINGQPSAEYMRRLVLCLTRPGDTVAQLYCGGGELCYIAAAEGRRFVGWDSSPFCINAARIRLLGLDGISFKIIRDLPEDGSAIIGMDVLRRDSRTDIMLSDYSHFGVPGKHLEGISFWAVGTLSGERFTVADYSARTVNAPALRESISLFSGGEGIICLCDCAGNEKYTLLKDAK